MDINNKGKEVLDRLFKGNENFINGISTATNRSVDTLQKFAKYQKPSLCILTCSDSRIVPEIIFDCGIGDMFTVRTAGHTIGDNVINSVEYAVMSLKVPLVVIMGHDDCGVMEFSNEQYPEKSNEFKSFTRCLYPVIESFEERPTNIQLSKQYAISAKKILIENSEIIRHAVESGKLHIEKCHLGHTSGRVTSIKNVNDIAY